MNDSSPGSARNLKSQLLPMIFPSGINGLPNDDCGAQISLSQTSLDTPPVAIVAKRGSSYRDLICPYGSSRNDGSSPLQENWRELVLRELLRKAEDIDADAIIRVDYQNDGVIRIDETGVNLKRVVATGIAVKLSCAA